MDFQIFRSIQGGSPTPSPRRDRKRPAELCLGQTSVETGIKTGGSDRLNIAWSVVVSPHHKSPFDATSDPGSPHTGAGSPTYSPSILQLENYTFLSRLGPAPQSQFFSTSYTFGEPNLPTIQEVRDYYHQSSTSSDSDNESEGSIDACHRCTHEPSSGSDVSPTFLPSTFSNRRRSFSPEEISSLSPFDVLWWQPNGEEMLLPRDEPGALIVFEAYKHGNTSALREGTYMWHDDAGNECSITVDVQERPKPTPPMPLWRLEQTLEEARREDFFSGLKDLVDLDPGEISALPIDFPLDNEILFPPGSDTMGMLYEPHQYTVGDLPQGYIYRWVDPVTGQKWTVETGPSPHDGGLPRRPEPAWVAEYRACVY